MERQTKITNYIDYSAAQKIMGSQIIGPAELQKAKKYMHLPERLLNARRIPKILISPGKLRALKKEGYLLVLGIPKDCFNKDLNIINLRSIFGHDTSKKEPCFYNQDWYLDESFAKKSLQFKWYLIQSRIVPKSRGKLPDELLNDMLNSTKKFPLAILSAFTFFAYYFITNRKLLWQYHFIWCSDKDHNGDRIYTGRYTDQAGINKNGFSVHRYLTINKTYGCVASYKL